MTALRRILFCRFVRKNGKSVKAASQLPLDDAAFMVMLKLNAAK
jgi:hypothetical protein